MAHILSVMPFQREFITATERFLTLMAGRRAGKTDAIKSRIKWRMRQPCFKYTYITPLFAQGLEVYRELTRDATYKHNIKFNRERPYPHFGLYNGAVCKFKSFQRPEGIRGTGEDEICLDESQDQSITEYDIKTIVLPMLGDRRGTLVLSGQFRGHDWRYEQFWVPGQASLDGKPNPKYRPQYKSWQVPAWHGYVFQGPDGAAELELQKSITPRAVWDQEWACIPTANVNAVFLPQNIDAIVRGEARGTPEHGRAYISGLDLGRVVDQSALVVIDINSRTVVYSEKLPQRMLHAEQALRVSRITNLFQCPCIIDVTGGGGGNAASGDTYIKFYRDKIRDVREFVWQRSNKEKIISNLSLEIENHTISIPSAHAELLKELRQYEYTYKNSYYDYHAPTGLHDDYVSALAMAVWGLNKGWVNTPGGKPIDYARF